MDEQPRKKSAVFRALNQQLRTYFELLKYRFAANAETDLERAQRLVWEKRAFKIDEKS
jgi:hypothetical protein